MELKSLIIGVLLAVSIFAMKSGVGIYYLTANMVSKKGRGLVFAMSALSYGLLFAGAFYLLRWLNHLALFPLFNKILKYGMPLHLALAFGMLVWSFYLLKRDHSHNTSKAFWMLIIPCPVCMTVVLLITAFIMAYFPKHGGGFLTGAYGIYLVIQAGIAFILFRLQKVSRIAPDRILGWGMLLIASYFILTVLIAPQMGGLNKIYRIANYKGDVELLKLNWVITVWATIAATFFIGLILRMLRIRGRK